MKPLLLFDLDGTLINTDHLIFESFIHTFQTMVGVTPTQEELLSYLGPALDSSLRTKIEEERIEEAMQVYRQFNNEKHDEMVTIYPHTKDVLEKLSHDYELAVCTTKRRGISLKGLQLFGIDKYFSIIITGEDVEHVKPDPEGLYKALSLSHCTTGIMIGDNISDIMAGKNAHMTTVGVGWTPKGIESYDACPPDIIINDFNELVTFVKTYK